MAKEPFKDKSVEKLKKLKNNYRIFGTVFIILSIAVMVFYFFTEERDSTEMLVAVALAIGGSGLFKKARQINMEIVSREENK